MWFLTAINNKLKGAPDEILTALLIGVAVLAVVTAIKANPVTKAFVAAWLIAP